MPPPNAPLTSRIAAAPGRAGPHPRRRLPARRRPLLEVLEDRLAPATFNPLPNVADSTMGNTLRADIIQANGNGQDNVINLQAGLYQLSIANTNGHESAAAQGDLNLTSAGHTIVFQGAGIDNTFIDANRIDRAFQILAGVTAVFRDLTIRDGLATDDGTPGSAPVAAEGGGILNNGGNVTLLNVRLEGNVADAASISGEPAFGGAIYSSGGTLTLRGCILNANRAFGNQGVDGVVSRAGGKGGEGAGGALLVTKGALTLAGCMLFKNIAEGGKGGHGGPGAPGAQGASGGLGGLALGGGLALMDGTAEITDSTLEENVARAGMGGGGGQGASPCPAARSAVLGAPAVPAGWPLAAASPPTTARSTSPPPPSVSTIRRAG
jgi:hypothetical protein